LPAFKHHDATEDSIACARIFLKLIENEEEASSKSISDEASEFKGIVKGILADEEVNPESVSEKRMAFIFHFWSSNFDFLSGCCAFRMGLDRKAAAGYVL